MNTVDQQSEKSTTPRITDAREHLVDAVATIAKTVGALMVEHDDESMPISRDVVREACRELATARAQLIAAAALLKGTR